MQVNVEYRISNLADLLEVACAIQGEVMAAEPGRKVKPEEIRIQGTEWNHITFALNSEQLTDGSTVYNVDAAA
jgi:hypothetical protein